MLATAACLLICVSCRLVHDSSAAAVTMNEAAAAAEADDASSRGAAETLSRVLVKRWNPDKYMHGGRACTFERQCWNDDMCRRRGSRGRVAAAAAEVEWRCEFHSRCGFQCVATAVTEGHGHHRL